MFFGHLPAGYIAARLLQRRAERFGVSSKRFLAAGMLGAVAPDIDMLYFYLVDQRQHNHHTYWTHFPITWSALLLASAIWLYAARDKRCASLVAIFCLNGFGHMLLDSIVGRIWWLAPFVDRAYSLFTVPALYQPWWLNFFLHWSFALELSVAALAIWWWRRPRAG
ncbi:MAG: metal-dependent hydrolase [Burkholderiales bacterium]|nr:metal-dependent hydrolase [Burkholderiales bacterium]